MLGGHIGIFCNIRYLCNCTFSNSSSNNESNSKQQKPCIQITAILGLFEHNDQMASLNGVKRINAKIQTEISEA